MVSRTSDEGVRDDGTVPLELRDSISVTNSNIVTLKSFRDEG